MTEQYNLSSPSKSKNLNNSTVLFEKSPKKGGESVKLKKALESASEKI